MTTDFYGQFHRQLRAHRSVYWTFRFQIALLLDRCHESQLFAPSIHFNELNKRQQQPVYLDLRSDHLWIEVKSVCITEKKNMGQNGNHRHSHRRHYSFHKINILHFCIIIWQIFVHMLEEKRLGEGQKEHCDCVRCAVRTWNSSECGNGENTLLAGWLAGSPTNECPHDVVQWLEFNWRAFCVKWFGKSFHSGVLGARVAIERPLLAHAIHFSYQIKSHALHIASPTTTATSRTEIWNLIFLFLLQHGTADTKHSLPSFGFPARIREAFSQRPKLMNDDAVMMMMMLV